MLGAVERSNAYLKTIYEKFCIDIPHIIREEYLSKTFRALSETTSSTTGIAPKSLVFGIFPDIAGGSACHSLMRSATIIRECMTVVVRMKAHQKHRKAVQNTKPKKDVIGANVATSK